MTRKEANDFKEILAQYVPRGSDFYQRITRAFDVLAQVRDDSDGHGITLLMRRDTEASALDRYLVDAQQYNGVLHNLKDHDITDVVSAKREKDLATIVDSENNIAGANVPLPMDVAAYKEKYGITAPMAVFLGYNEGEEAPGARTQSALCATDIIGGSICIVTLGETRPDGRKGPINVYYKGDRIYNGSGRRMRWELADADKRPAQYKNVEAFPTSSYHHCGPRREESRACAMGGPL